MACVYVSLGSNVDREARIRQAVDALRYAFSELELSTVYDSVAIGFDGSNFLNLVAGFDCDHEVAAVAAIFRDIEDRLGRDRSLPRFANRAIDLDILLYDNLVLNVPGIRIPRPDILVNAFVLKPLQDLAPELRHPQTGESYAELWQAMMPDAPQLEPFAMDL
jgi:2-amino-4-hydroxy-6-hydroxymethyldihydropteridine diphosphokinase